jgi:hypothetical protein
VVTVVPAGPVVTMVTVVSAGGDSSEL